jgi:hypothetical protein
MSEIGLPENLWMGVAAVNDKAPEADVKVKMHDSQFGRLSRRGQRELSLSTASPALRRPSAS